MSTLTPEIILMFGLLGLTVMIFASEWLRIDVAALCILLLLAFTQLIPGISPLLPIEHVFSGFSSNAVMAIIGVMILGEGLNKAGVLQQLAGFIVRLGGSSERRLTALIGGSAGAVSSFMQNTGAAALYIPVVSHIAHRSGLAMNRLLLPMGFCAIVGGTLTTIGSSPLILLNDLLPETIEQIELFEVTPIGITLLISTTLYFVLFGHLILPAAKPGSAITHTPADYFQQTYGLTTQIYELNVPPNSSLVGMTIETIELSQAIRVIAAQTGAENRVAPAAELSLDANSVIAVLGSPAVIEDFARRYHLNISDHLNVFARELMASQAGIAEIVIPPRSNLVGKTVAELNMRSRYGLSVLTLRRGETDHNQRLTDMSLQVGDTLVCHSRWAKLANLLHDRNFLLVDRNFPHEESNNHKAPLALAWIATAIILVITTDLPLALCLLTGAVGMVLSKVLTMDEAYRAINWSTVFLLACLIPVGLAVEYTGAAAWIAQNALLLLGDVPSWVLQTLIAVLATFFSLTISNVGATVLLVPLVVNLAQATGDDPRLFALTAAICASNAFVLPTHQVNALIMGPGEYKVRDFIRAGIGMTIIYLLVALTALNFFI